MVGSSVTVGVVGGRLVGELVGSSSGFSVLDGVGVSEGGAIEGGATEGGATDEGFSLLAGGGELGVLSVELFSCRRSSRITAGSWFSMSSTTA